MNLSKKITTDTASSWWVCAYRIHNAHETYIAQERKTGVWFVLELASSRESGDPRTNGFYEVLAEHADFETARIAAELIV